MSARVPPCFYPSIVDNTSSTLYHDPPPPPPSLRRASYMVVAQCAPLLRMTPDLDSMPGAQLSVSSGRIFTADPAKVFGTTTTITTTTTTTTSAAEAAAAAAALTPGSAETATTTASPKTGEEEGEGEGEGEGTPSGEATAAAAASESLPPDEISPSSESSPSHSPKETVGVATRTESGAAVVAAAAAADVANEKNPGGHPLVLSGRRVWMISPVVGWASVWAETGPSILTPAVSGDSEEDAGGGGEKGAKGVAARAGVASWPGLKQSDIDWLNPLLSGAGKVGKGGTNTNGQKKPKTPGAPPGDGTEAGAPPGNGKATSMTSQQMAAAITSSMKKLKKMAADGPSKSNAANWATPPSLPSSWFLHGPEGIPGTPHGPPSSQASPLPPQPAPSQASPSPPAPGVGQPPPVLPGGPADYSSQLSGNTLILQSMVPQAVMPPHPWAAASGAEAAAIAAATSAGMFAPLSAPGGPAPAGDVGVGLGELGPLLATPSPSGGGGGGGSGGGGGGGDGGPSGYSIAAQSSSAVYLEEEAKTE